MEEIRNMYAKMGISNAVFEYGEDIVENLKERFAEIDRNAEYNQLKVLKAMQDHQVSEACLLGTTGYGYNDLGRDTLEQVYASVFHTEDALVRPQITCGTHALALALMSNLRPGDELLSPVGKPYDTLEEVIGIRPSRGSLAEYGITYRQVDLNEDGSFDWEGIAGAVNERTRLVTIQRSKGYQTRPTLSVKRIGELIEQGQFATNVELAEAPGYERQKTAERLWYIARDISDEYRDKYLGIVRDLRGGFPDETAKIAVYLSEPESLQAIIKEYRAFFDAYKAGEKVLRFRYPKPEPVFEALKDLTLPRKTFTSEMTEIPHVDGFITEDEIDEALAGGSNVSGSKGRIYDFYQTNPTPKEQAAFLKKESAAVTMPCPGASEVTNGTTVRVFATRSPTATMWNCLGQRLPSA